MEEKATNKQPKKTRLKYILLALIIAPTLSGAVPLFTETSITRDQINGTGLPWDRIEKQGLFLFKELPGKTKKALPSSSQPMTRQTKRPIHFDVTQAVNQIVGKNDQLFMIKSSFPVDFSSREGISPPILRITLSNGEIGDLKPTLDNFITSSSHKNFNGKLLRVNPNRKIAFIQFKLPKTKIQFADLILTPVKTYGSGNVDIYPVDLEQQKKKSSCGIVDKVKSYEELKGKPGVVFVDTFEGDEINPAWETSRLFHSGIVDSGSLNGLIEPDKGEHSAFSLRYPLKEQLGEEPEEMYVRYSIKFDKNFAENLTQGGKLPGLSGTYDRCGWGGRKPREDCEGWSARIGYYKPTRRGDYVGIPPYMYLYHLGQKRSYGDRRMWGVSCEIEKWCEIEQYVKLNTPGKNDGIIRGWMDGKLAYEATDILYRGDPNVKIEYFWAQVYHGGKKLSNGIMGVELDNVVISREYIGSL